MQIRLEAPDQPELVALIGELDAYQTALYPAESNHLVDLATLCEPRVLFAVARNAAGGAVDCGAVVAAAAGADGELKRMFVSPRCRGHGIAKALLDVLEREARERGCRVLRLETGIRQPEALGLYAACGYARCAAFGDYPADDPLSVFMHKRLDD